jgi:hypothetical protein
VPACSVVYDLITQGYENWGLPALGLLVTLAAGALFFTFNLIPFAIVPSSAKKAMLVSAIVSLVWAVVTLGITYLQYSDLKQSYQHGEIREVFGRIENLTTSGPEIQPGTVRFSVRGVSFAYSKFVSSPGFRGLPTTINSLHDGLTVRIKYIGTAIVRLEICDT